MKKIIIAYLFIFTMVASCTEDITSLNENVKDATEVPAETLFSNAQKELTDLMTSTSVNDNVYRLLAQYWTETTYIDESNYDIATRNIPQNFWHTIYRDVLKDLSESKSLITEDDSYTDDVLKANQLALIDIMEVYAWSVLVNTFGDVPYSEALDFNNVLPAYDDASAIYDDLISRLDADLATLSTASESFGTADLLYGGDVASWVMFANSLKLRMGITLADVDPGKAKTIVEQAAPGAFKSMEQSAIFYYLNAPPNTNPIWESLVQSGRNDFVVANTLVDKMMELSDPRVPSYFTVDANGEYVGGIYGSSNNYATYSKVDETITVETFPSVLIDYVEVEFILAEAIERGMTVGGTAAEHYNNAITNSMQYWSSLDPTEPITEEQITAYLASPSVAYATAAGTYKQKIGTQKWIALYNRGFEAWTEWRRLDYPELVAPVEAVSTIPVRLTYPVSEQNLNGSNFDVAAGKLSDGNRVSSHLFWDVQ